MDTDTDLPPRSEYSREKIVVRDADAPERWRVKKSIDTNLMLLIVANLAGGVWFASNIYDKVNSNEKRITALETTATTQSLSLANRLEEVGTRLTRIETTLLDIKATAPGK